MAHADGMRFIDDLLLFVSEDLEQQRGYREDDPFDRDPPPADEDPPEDAVMRVLQPGFVDHLNIDILTAAFRTNHFVTTFRK